jgi:hypothetical protein
VALGRGAGGAVSGSRQAAGKERARLVGCLLGGRLAKAAGASRPLDWGRPPSWAPPLAAPADSPSAAASRHPSHRPRPHTHTHARTHARTHAHLEQAAAVAQRVAEQGVARRPPWQRRAQHGAVGQHEAPQQLKVVLPGLVRHVDRAAANGARHAVQLRRGVRALGEWGGSQWGGGCECAGLRGERGLRRRPAMPALPPPALLALLTAPPAAAPQQVAPWIQNRVGALRVQTTGPR